MPGYIYAQDQAGAIYVNLFVSSSTAFVIAGKPLRVSVESDMPWGGTSRLSVSTTGPVRGTVKLRIPGWTRNRPVPASLYTYADRAEETASIHVNGTKVSAVPDAMGYVSLTRDWNDGDVVRVDLPVHVRRVVADDRVTQNRHRTAIERGPIVYCAEWP